MNLESRLQEIKGKHTFVDRIRYCKEHFEVVSMGGSTGSRAVFDVGDGKVIKVAKSAKGIAQNDAEGDYGVNSMYPDTLNHLYDSDCDEGTFLVSKKLDKVAHMNVVYEHYGMEKSQFESTLSDINNYVLKQGRSDFPNVNGETHEAMAYLLDLCLSTDLLAGDFLRPSSWGIDPDTKTPKIIDSGLRLSVYRDHYNKKTDHSLGFAY